MNIFVVAGHTWGQYTVSRIYQILEDESNYLVLVYGVAECLAHLAIVEGCLCQVEAYVSDAELRGFSKFRIQGVGRIEDPLDIIAAPVIDGMVTGFKMAEMMADITGLTTIPPVSRTGFFQSPPQKDFDALRGFLGR